MLWACKCRSVWRNTHINNLFQSIRHDIKGFYWFSKSIFRVLGTISLSKGIKRNRNEAYSSPSHCINQFYMPMLTYIHNDREEWYAFECVQNVRYDRHMNYVRIYRLQHGCCFTVTWIPIEDNWSNYSFSERSCNVSENAWQLPWRHISFDHIKIKLPTFNCSTSNTFSDNWIICWVFFSETSGISSLAMLSRV